MNARRLVVAIAATAALLPAGAGAVDWPTFHGDNTRQGDDTADPGLSAPVAAWTSPSLDGAVYGSPVTSGGQGIVATENDTVYSLDASNGSVQWSRHVGTPRTSNFPCGNIDPLGITGTPVVSAGSVYVAAEVQASSTVFHFELVTLNLADGSVTRTVTIDPADSRFDANVQQQRGALTLTDGKVFVPLGGLDGDCGNYHGYVLAYPASGSGSVQWWADTEDDPSNREGGIWATGGLSVDAAGYVYASTGNGSHTSSSSAYDYSDGVMKIDPNVVRPADFFAPKTWYQDNAGDVDLGSTTTLQLPNRRAFIVGKSGVGYLLDTTAMRGIGGQVATHRVCHATNGAAFGSLAYDGGRAFVGCSDGLAAVDLSTTDFSVAWYTTNGSANHPPTVAGGAVWSIDSSGSNLLGFNTSDGQQVHSFPIGTSTHFTTAAATNGQILVGAGTQVRAFGTMPTPPVNGLTLDAFGGVHHFGSVASNTLGGPSWPGWQIARGIAARADHNGSYVLDGWGGIHSVGGAPALAGTAWWPGWDIARAIALSADASGGYVLDGWGGVHPFGAAPDVTATSYWHGWDIARAILLRPDGRSGWVLDGWGGLHGFAATGTPMPPDVSGTGPYWLGWDIARGGVVTGSGGGYVLDAWGGVHPFGNAGATSASGYQPGGDIARGIALYSQSPVAGYWLDAFGGIHAVGSAPEAAPPAYLPGQDVFRGISVTG